MNCPNILLISPEKSLILTSRSFLILTQYRATKDYQDLLIPNSHCIDEKPKFREREGLCLERCHVRTACLILVLVLIQYFLKMFSKKFILTTPCYIIYCIGNNLNTEKKYIKFIGPRGRGYPGTHTYFSEDVTQPCGLLVFFRTWAEAEQSQTISPGSARSEQLDGSNDPWPRTLWAVLGADFYIVSTHNTNGNNNNDNNNENDSWNFNDGLYYKPGTLFYVPYILKLI